MLPVPGAKPNIPFNSTTCAIPSQFPLQFRKDRSVYLYYFRFFIPLFSTIKNIAVIFYCSEQSGTSHLSLQLRSISLTPAFNTNKNGISARFSGFLFPSSRDMFAPKIEHTFVFLCCSTPFFECKNLFCRKYETYHVTAEGIRTPHTSHLPLISTISKNPSHFSLQLDRKTPAFSLCCFVTAFTPFEDYPAC